MAVSTVSREELAAQHELVAPAELVAPEGLAAAQALAAPHAPAVPQEPVRHRAPATVALMGLGVAAISESETIRYVLDGLAAGHGGWICTANLDILRQWWQSAEVRELVSSADLVVADGMPLIWAGGLQGTPLPERVAGSTLLLSLSAAAAAVDASIFLLGGNPGTAETAAEKLTAMSPGLRLAGTLCPPMGFEDDSEWVTRIQSTLDDTRPDIVYVGLGFPKQETMIVGLRERMPNTWFVGCGVSFSFLSGEIHRAPELVQRLGLEWLHRMAQEPQRLSRRYLVHGIPFLAQLLSAALMVRMGQVRRR